MSKLTPQKRAKFIAALRETCNVTKAAESVAMSRQGVYQARDNDAEFAKAWQGALEEAVDLLEAEAQRRAFSGVDKPVTYQGRITATYREYSDTLAFFLLRAHRPEKYRERSETRHDVADPLADLMRAINGHPVRPVG